MVSIEEKFASGNHRQGGGSDEQEGGTSNLEDV